MAQYLLLLHESPDAFRGLSPAEIQAIIQHYVAWRHALERAGRFVGGQKLEPGGRALRRDGGSGEILDGPFAESKEVLGGFLMVEADSYDHAAEMARSSPHFERGWIEIRRVDLV